jgi:CRP-like cAMP-binding protein
MASLLTLLKTQPARELAPGEALIVAGEPGDGTLYVLDSGRLVVARDGVDIATIDTPGALVGEMSVLLGTPSSATVRAEAPSTVRVIENAISFLERTPIVALHVATLACERLDRTSALVVELRRQAEGRAEQSVLARIVSALTGT